MTEDREIAVNFLPTFNTSTTVCSSPSRHGIKIGAKRARVISAIKTLLLSARFLYALIPSYQLSKLAMPQVMMLEQKMPDGTEKPISFASWTLSAVE